MKDYMNVPISIKVSRAQKQQLDRLATDLGRTQSELVREAIMVLLGVYYGNILAEKDTLATPVDKGVAGGQHKV